MIFDAGVFIALENPAKRRVILALLEKLLQEETPPATTSTALAQAWRDPARQVAMTRLVAAMTKYPFGDPQVIGVRCGRSGTSDVVDASLAVLADQLADSVLTTDPKDMQRLGVSHIVL